MTDIYSAVDLTNFQFTTRCTPFNWRLLHGLDVDTLVRLNDVRQLEAVIPSLQQGSIDAEGALSSHNYVQLFRLVQLAVEHLWQMRESHAKLYPAYAAAVTAAEDWKAAAGSYLDVGGQLLSQLQSEEGAVLTEQLLTEVAVAREALEKADASYNTALYKLEAEDAAARCNSLRRQRLEISWRLVFGLDVQHMLITSNVSELEQMLPQVAYGNIMAENLAALTPAHFRQLLLLGQACLDYLHAICCATSTVLEQQVQQLAVGSGPIPELTTACEELRAALAAALSSSIQVLKASAGTASPRTHTHAPPTATPTVTPVKSAAAAASTAAASSPSCQHVAHLQMTGHQGSDTCNVGCTCACAGPHSPRCCHSRRSCGHCHGGSGSCCCSSMCAASIGGRPECSALLSSRLFDVGLAPAANRLQLRIEQLDRDLRHERECTQGMRQALEEITDMLQDLPSSNQQQHRQRHQHPAKPQQAQQDSQHQQHPHTVNVPVTISMSGEGGRSQEPPPASPGSARDQTGAVRVLINEDTIRARERSAAGQQLSEHISDIIMGHQRSHYSPHSTMSGQFCGSPSRSKGCDAFGRPFVTVRSIPSASGERSHHAQVEAAELRLVGQRASGEFSSGPERGWRYSRSPTAYSSQQGAFAVGEAAAQREAVGMAAIAAGRTSPRVTGAVGPADGAMQPTMGLGLGEFMIQQLQAQQLQQQWPTDPHQAVNLQAPATSGDLAGSIAVAALAAVPSDMAVPDTSIPQQQPARAAQSSSPTPEDPSKKVQQALFKEAATGGFRKLLRSVSPKRMFGSRPSSASGQGSPQAQRHVATAATAAAGAVPRSGAVPAGALQWPPLAPGSVSSSPDTSPTRSGRSFTASVASKAAEELGMAAARQPQAAPGEFSPLKASIVAQVG